MENNLRKTIIRLQQQNQQLHFYKIVKFNKYGCKAIFTDKFTNKLYDVIIITKSLLQLDNHTQAYHKMIKKYQQITSKLFCPIYSLPEDTQFYYIITEMQSGVLLSDLINKRQGLTQFEILYFVLDLIQILNFLKPRSLFYQFISPDQIYLNGHIKITMPFSINLSQQNYYNNNNRALPLKYQDKKHYICPELLSNNINNHHNQSMQYYQSVNSWNLGVFIYQLLECKKPFHSDKQQLVFSKQKLVSTEMKKLLKKLLCVNSKDRLKFSLIIIEDIFKKYQNLPQILPITIFYCPPSVEYITEYNRKFFESSLSQYQKQQQNDIKNNNPTKIMNIRTVNQIQNENSTHKKLPVKSFKSFKFLKHQDENINETKYFVAQFVDISHRLGYGYQMNSGLIGFVFNDGTEMFFQNYEKKKVMYKQKKQQITEYSYEKFPEQGEIKKKLYILQAYSKSLKSQKIHQLPQSDSSISNNSTNSIRINKYVKTNYAFIFLLNCSTATIHFIFIDKINVLLTKNSLQIKYKSMDKFEHLQNLSDNSYNGELLIRKKYCLAMAMKIFHWNVQNLQKINPKFQKDKQKGSKVSLKKLSSVNQFFVNNIKVNNQEPASLRYLI